MGDSSPKSKNKQKHQDATKKQHDAATAAAKQAPAALTVPGRKGGK
ncbi:MAG: hypothetical protein ACYC7A_20065 [Thermoanaerobaculia bacterium]